MKKNIFKKCLIFSVILLFIVSGIVSGYDQTSTSSSYNCEIVQNKYSNYNFNVEFPTMKPIYIDSIIIDSSIYDITIVDTPAEFSWKNIDGKDYSTPVKSQGNCGSCGLFSAIAALESVIKIREDRPDIEPDLSEQYILSCLPEAALIPGEGCNGGMAYKAYKLMMESTPKGNNVNGAVLESFFPYEASDDIPCSIKRLGWDENLIPISDCGQISIGHDSPENRERIKSIIMDKGPIAAYMYVPLNPNVFHNWGYANHNPTDYWPYEEMNFEALNHEIVMLGWKDDPSIVNGGYWICKNSWGPNWGYDGFYNIEYGALFTGYLIDWVDYDPDSFNWPEEAHPPSSPSVNGPTEGKAGSQYEYIISTIDQDDDLVYYTINWDDGVVEKYIGPYNSGEKIIITHTWDRRGSYSLKVKSHDIWGAQSEWTTISVTMPKFKLINSPFINKIDKASDLVNLFVSLFNQRMSRFNI